MAAEEFSQGAALGPDFSEPTGGDPLADAEIPDLHAVLAEFMVALSVVEMVYRTLNGLMDEESADVGPCAVALGQGFEMLDAVYTRFDKGLLGYTCPGGNEPEELENHSNGDSNSDGNAESDPPPDQQGRKRMLGKLGRLAQSVA